MKSRLCSSLARSVAYTALITLIRSNHSERSPHSAQFTLNYFAVPGIRYGCARAGPGFFAFFLGADFLDGFFAGIRLNPFVNEADRAARASIECPRATDCTIQFHLLNHSRRRASLASHWLPQFVRRAMAKSRSSVIVRLMPCGTVLLKLASISLASLLVVAS
jgi:hypothetical protein